MNVPRKRIEKYVARTSRERFRTVQVMIENYAESDEERGSEVFESEELNKLNEILEVTAQAWADEVLEEVHDQELGKSTGIKEPILSLALTNEVKVFTSGFIGEIAKRMSWSSTELDDYVKGELTTPLRTALSSFLTRRIYELKESLHSMIESFSLDFRERTLNTVQNDPDAKNSRLVTPKRETRQRREQSHRQSLLSDIDDDNVDDEQQLSTSKVRFSSTIANKSTGRTPKARTRKLTKSIVVSSSSASYEEDDYCAPGPTHQVNSMFTTTIKAGKMDKVD